MARSPLPAMPRRRRQLVRRLDPAHRASNQRDRQGADPRIDPVAARRPDRRRSRHERELQRRDVARSPLFWVVLAAIVSLRGRRSLSRARTLDLRLGRGSSSAAAAFRSWLTCWRGPVAQLVEQGTFNPKVAGSRPARPTQYAVQIRSPCQQPPAAVFHVGGWCGGMRAASGVAADEQHRCKRHADGRVAAEQRKACPRCEAVRIVGDREDRTAGVRPEIRSYRVVPARWKTFMSGGRTKMIAAKAAMPPAVLRMIAPRPSSNADHGQVERSADHCPWDAGMRRGNVRVLPGEDRLAREERDQRRGKHQREGDEREDDALAQSTGSRFGTARMSHESSRSSTRRVITRTPRTPIASWATWSRRGRSSGLKSARSAGLLRSPVTRDHGRSEDRETDREHVATSSDQRVERTRLSFVHSETIDASLRDAAGEAASGRAGALTRRPPRLGGGTNSSSLPSQIHERFLERSLVRRELVEHDAVRGGGVTDLLGGKPAHLQLDLGHSRLHRRDPKESSAAPVPEASEHARPASTRRRGSRRRSCRRSACHVRSRSGGRRSATSRSSGATRRRRCGPQPQGPAEACGSSGFPPGRARSPARRASPYAGRRAAPLRSRAAGPCRARTCRRVSLQRRAARRGRSARRPDEREIPCVCASASRWFRAERPVCTERASSSAPTSCSGAA